MTSHDAVFKLRKILGEKKIGHGGTLDPQVTGVLPVAVGKATRVLEFMTEAGKVYVGEITLGFSTTTEDAEGQVVAQKAVSDQLTISAIDQAMTAFIGNIEQTPPMYSAVKVNGKKLYEYARANQVVERPSRQVNIKSFKRTSVPIFENGLCRFSFEVACSKGTYVRTLAVDLGKVLGYPSHMSWLERQASAGLQLDQALSLADIQEKVAAGDLSFLLPIAYAVSDLVSVELNEEQVKAISFGQFITLTAKEQQLAAFYQDQFIAILERRESVYKPRKVLI